MTDKVFHCIFIFTKIVCPYLSQSKICCDKHLAGVSIRRVISKEHTSTVCWHHLLYHNTHSNLNRLTKLPKTQPFYLTTECQTKVNAIVQMQKLHTSSPFIVVTTF